MFTKHEPTQEQKEKAEARRAAFRQLTKKIADMSQEERSAFASKMPCVMTIEGRSLSSTNMLLVCFQYGTATIVGGFNQWKKNGRKVKKGESGISIWIPKLPSKKDDENAEAEGFFMGYVFDISQTEPIEAERNSAGAVVTPALRDEWNKMQDFIKEPQALAVRTEPQVCNPVLAAQNHVMSRLQAIAGG